MCIYEKFSCSESKDERYPQPKVQYAASEAAQTHKSSAESIEFGYDSITLTRIELDMTQWSLLLRLGMIIILNHQLFTLG